MTRLTTTADRLATGSTLLARRLAARAAAWVRRARRDDLTGWQAALGCWARLALLALGGYLLWRLIRAFPNLLWLLTGTWIITAWRAGRNTTAPSTNTPAEPPADHTPEDVRAATLEWIWQRIGEAQGVHLRDLLAHAHAHGMFEDLDVATFRTHLERWRIPVRARVRVRGLGVTVGIHRDDLQPPAATSPDAPSPEQQKTELHPV
ncbi:hypothetical protein ACIQFU_23055 [Streptomyces sp. NPDC093065]|uniref:hypothetical protein n=1 Tax=Streptomyces sp. NPDC093065 TaxID=3366021 RepID=UPI00382A31DF